MSHFSLMRFSDGKIHTTSLASSLTHRYATKAGAALSRESQSHREKNFAAFLKVTEHSLGPFEYMH